MAVNKSTYYLLGLSSGGGDDFNGFQVGWQYRGWDEIVKRYTKPEKGDDGINLSRDGTVTITDKIKNKSENLYQVGVVFVLGQWGKTTTSLGGKFDWIGHGEMGGDYHDLNSQNIVKKLEDPVGVTKPANYWFKNGAQHGPCIVSVLLKKKSGLGGVIVACFNDDGFYGKALEWADIGSK